MNKASRPEIAVGAIVVHDGALLMVQRGQEPALGAWTIPGGRVEHGEYLADAVKREVLEETGLAIDVGEIAGIFEVLGDTHYVILDFHSDLSEGATTELTAGDDVAEARWVPVDDVSSMECTPRLVEMLRAWSVLS